MANTKAENAVAIMGLEKRFIVDSVVQLNLISNNLEDAYDILENDFDLITTINLRTGKEITFEVEWSEVEEIVMVSKPDEEEVYIDMMQDRKEHTLDQIWLVDSPPLQDEKALFNVGSYTVIECGLDRTSYYLINEESNLRYEMLLETCFSLMSRYLDEDNRYILHEELIQLELNAVK
ncbi:hypothetical protein ABE073_03880 [Lederbergia citrisecunda]|uniref:hypothetical protein n=1 Tax=Lederbergia citrisecunda TaxID=2833583 RepID=UPI003D293EE8